jgi:hypothetical protein
MEPAGALGDGGVDGRGLRLGGVLDDDDYGAVERVVGDQPPGADGGLRAREHPHDRLRRLVDEAADAVPGEARPLVQFVGADELLPASSSHASAAAAPPRRRHCSYAYDTTSAAELRTSGMVG